MRALYIQTEKYIEEAFAESHLQMNITHLKRTAYWITELREDADETLQIAALSHDIERAFRGKAVWNMAKERPKGLQDPEFLTYHQETGAKLMRTFLLTCGGSHDVAERIAHLISKHEEGGDDDQNLLKDADSISFFENNVEHFVTKKVDEIGVQKVREKIDWMFNRIASEQAKDIAQKWYDKAIDRLKI